MVESRLMEKKHIATVATQINHNLWPNSDFTWQTKKF